MKKFIAIALVALATPVAAQNTPVGVTYKATVVKVVDGDTVQIKAPWVPAPIKPQVSIRIFGVDTPEKGFRAQCPAEDAKGHAATVFTTDLVAKAKKIQYVLYDWDKYGGRVLGDVLLDGKSLRAQLIANGYAREYFGGAKQSWCK